MKWRSVAAQSLLAICVIFTVATLVSSAWQLLSGTASDANLHILLRAALVAIGVAAAQIVWRLKLKSKILNYLAAYILSLALVFAAVFVTGLATELNRNAYRDVFLNYTIAFAIIAVALHFGKKITRKKV